jgi:acetyl-CoA carboxylase carboxyltransferase component
MNKPSSPSRLRSLTDDFLRLEKKLKQGGGAEKIEKIHKQGKLAARERIELLLDKESFSKEIGLVVAYDV